MLRGFTNASLFAIAEAHRGALACLVPSDKMDAYPSVAACRMEVEPCARFSGSKPADAWGVDDLHQNTGSLLRETCLA